LVDVLPKIREKFIGLCEVVRCLQTADMAKVAFPSFVVVTEYTGSSDDIGHGIFVAIR
jgi:hypothetical protein